MTKPHCTTDHSHPCFYVCHAVVNVFMVFDEHFQIAKCNVFEHDIDVLIFGGVDGSKSDNIWVREFLEALDFANSVHG